MTYSYPAQADCSVSHFMTIAMLVTFNLPFELPFAEAYSSSTPSFRIVSDFHYK